MTEVLPDSRLIDPKATVMADWKWRDALGVEHCDRLELEPIFCFNCGHPTGYVPRGVMSFVSFLCSNCHEKWGAAASLHTSPDEEFWNAVGAEIESRFGRSLTQAELNELADQGRLGRNLELLDRESPYRKAMKS